jgi:hypothetical protein
MRCASFIKIGLPIPTGQNGSVWQPGRDFLWKEFFFGFFRLLVAKEPVFVLWVAKGHETPPSERRLRDNAGSV